MSNSNTNLQTQSSNALHNAIMEAGSKDRPPMLAPGNYVQWKSRIKRYIDTKPNSELIHHYLQNPPYTYQWAEKTVPVAEGSSETTTERYMENYKNVSQDIRDQLNAEAEAVQIILTGIDNDIYSTVDACPNACEMWKAIERLKQGESINVQDLETNLYWEFGKFTSRDGESLESYYSRFYKMMNELVRNQCHVTNHQVNVQFLLQLQPEWQSFITSEATPEYKDNEDKNYKTSTYAIHLHLLLNNNQFTILKTILLKTLNIPPPDSKLYQETEEKQLLPSSAAYLLSQNHAMKIYKPTNNNLRTSSNTSRANQDNSPRINRGTGYDNQRVVNVAGARENVDLVQGTITIKRVYYVEGLNHNLFSVGQFCDADLEVAFQKSTCYIRDLKGNDLLKGSRGTDLYSITLQDSTTPNLICLMAKATSSQAWLWHRRLSHLNFDTINLLSKNNIVNGLPKLKFVKDHLCSSCELGKAKRKSFHTKTTPSSKRRLQLLHMDLCGPMRVESHYGNKSKDETPGVLIDFLTLVQRGLHAQVTIVRTDKGTEFLNKTLHAYFAKEGIRHETSTARTPEQNGVVERRNRTLVEAARTMLSAAKVSLFFWAEAIATVCFTQNRSLVIPRHEKTPYHIINARKPSVKFFHIFGSLCYIIRDGENLDKMKEKGDACIFVGYSTQSKAYRVFNKRTRMIVETIHVNFDELPQMASDHVSSDPGPQCPTTVLEQESLSPSPQSSKNVPQFAETVTTSNELELLYSPMFSELIKGTSHVVSKSFAVHVADNPDKHQQHNTTHTSTTTDVADPPPLNIYSTHQTSTQVPTVTAPENIIQAETNTENAQSDDDEFINIFSTPVQEQGETSSRHVDSSNMHTFYQHHPSAQRWTKDHPLEQVIGNPSQSVRTRRQLEIDGEMCMKNFISLID
ncbi:retrovirus-related pol polyprotein from transposon TNT 1-94 [Tanacetum coccineum]